MTVAWSHNGKWQVIDGPIPLRSSVRVQKFRMLTIGFCWFRWNDGDMELIGGVWSSPPDTTDYDQNTLVGHTGINWDGDDDYVDAARKKCPNRYTDE